MIDILFSIYSNFCTFYDIYSVLILEQTKDNQSHSTNYKNFFKKGDYRQKVFRFRKEIKQMITKQILNTKVMLV